MDLTYHGYSAFELTGKDGTTILIDPYIEENGHCESTVDEFDEIDSILVTHGAFDHLGDAPAIATANDATIHCDFATFTHLLNDDSFDGKALGYIWGMEIKEDDDWSAKVVEARHLSMFWKEGLLGPALAYIVSLDGQQIYHMGDTSIFRDIELFGDLYEPTISLIPVGQVAGYLTELHPDEAALAAEWLGSETIVPMHYPPGSENPERFHELCQERGVDDGSDIQLLEPGHTLSV